MANIIFDFLTESFLFNEKFIENGYRTISEEKLERELHEYREYIQKNFETISKEISDDSALRTSIESLGMLPNEQLLKQLALYMDKVVVADPIFDLTHEKSNTHIHMSKLMGINSNTNIDRAKLANNAKYMKWSALLVTTQFIKYMPVSLIHEPPKDLPILYSEDNFSNELTKDLYKFFHEKAKISNVIKQDGVMSYHENDELKLGTTIAVNFDEEHIRKGHIYQFAHSKVEGFDVETGRAKLMQYIPDSIEENEFKNWVYQSINRAAIAEYRTTLNEAILARKMQCMYLAKSKFTADLLAQTVAKKDVQSELANLSMSIELPILDQISVNDLMSIRYNNGEAFYNFRNELNTKLLELRGITDKDELETKIQNIMFEINELQVNDVKKEYRKILRSFKVDATVLVGSLMTSFFTGGLTMIGAAGAIAKGGTDYIKYLNDVKENNGYFIWKLKRSIKNHLI